MRALPPWHANLGLPLVKTPKVLLGDTGLLCHLLGLDAARLQADDLMTGAALECFVASELTKQSLFIFPRKETGGRLSPTARHNSL